MRYWWEYWRETICMTIIYICMGLSIPCYVAIGVALGYAVADGMEIARGIIGIAFFAGCGVTTIWCFVGIIRA